MYYKLYKEKSKEHVNRPRSLDLFKEFKKIYDENDVKVIGVWENLDDPHEFFFMTAFRDENHYKKFVDQTKSNQNYQDMSDEMADQRESIEITNLRMVVDL